LRADVALASARLDALRAVFAPPSLAASGLAEHNSSNIGDLHCLLVECATAAILSGAERIDEKLVASFSCA
jgi:hypothetical protein